MRRTVSISLLLTLLAALTPAQSPFRLSQLIGQLPLSPKHEYGDSMSFLYATPEGHELSILMRKDSTIHTFIAHPAKSYSPESARRAYAKLLLANAFGNDSALSSWFDRVGESLNDNGDAVRRLNRNGWRFMLMYDNHAISRFIVRTRNVRKP